MADINKILDKNGKPLTGAALDARMAKLEREKTSDTGLDKKIEEKVEQALEQSPNTPGGGKKDFGGGTRLAQLYNKATSEGGGTVGSIFTASKERLKEKLDVRNSFGKGLMGAVGEKVFGKGYDALKQGDTGSLTPAPVSGDSEQNQQMSDDIGILTKNSMVFPGMARDVNVIRQNMAKITNSMIKKKSKVEGKKDSKEAATKADMYFLKADEQEAKLEAERNKLKSSRVSKTPTPAPQKKEEGFSLGSIVQKAIGWLKDGLFKGLKMLFNPSNLMKTLGKVFVIGTLIAALVNGIMDGWKTWQETGDLGEAIISGLAGIVDFLTFGIFNKDDIKDVFRKIGDFLDPVIDTISGVVTTIKDWVVNNVGIPKVSLGSVKNPITGTEYSLGSIGPWYPFKSNPKSEAAEVSAKPKAKEVASQPAADKAEAAAVKKEKQQSEPAKVGEVGAPAASESVSPAKAVETAKDDQKQVFIEKANYFQKKRDEELSRVEKIKKARDQAAKDGASPEELQSFNIDINKSITAAGDYERQRIETLMKAGETPKPEIKVPEEIKKSTQEFEKALGGETAPTQLPTSDVNVNVSGETSPTATRRSSFDRVRLGTPDEAGKSEIKEQKPSVINTLSDSDAKSIFSESASPSPAEASSGGGDSVAAAMAPTGETSTTTPSISAGGGGSAGQSPSLTDSATSMPTGATISESSAQVAEEQRTEMSMSEPTIINNQATNTTNGTVGADNKTAASVVDDVFAQMVAA